MKPWGILILIISALLIISGLLLKSGSEQTFAAKSVSMNIASSSTAERIPVIVELFTSEGCSSCPPADDVLSQLEKQQPVAGVEVIALGEHVDYWNYIGWADPFSSNTYSKRQGDYARTLGSEIYTPQMVVDGQAHLIGSQAEKATEVIEKAAHAPKAKLKIERLNNSSQSSTDVVGFRVSATNIPKTDKNEVVDILLAVTERDLQSSVASGENAGRHLKHGTVVRQFNLIHSADPSQSDTLTAEHSIILPNQWQRDKLRAVAILQEHNSQRIIGAATLGL